MTTLRIRILALIFLIITAAITFKLFNLQIWNGADWRTKAAAQHFEAIKIPATRGRIFTRDRDGSLHALATNIAKYTLFLDPKFILEESKNVEEIAYAIPPIIIDIWESRTAKKPKLSAFQNKLRAEKWLNDHGGIPTATLPIEFWQKIDQPTPITLGTGSQIITGAQIFIEPAKDENEKTRDEKIADLRDYLRSQIYKNPRGRWVPILRRLSKNTADKIKNLKLKGIGIERIEERFYPEGKLAANLIGFVDREGRGQFGLEQSLDTELRGKGGWLDLRTSRTKVEKTLQQGKDITLTIDRSLQKYIEDTLSRHLWALDAESVQAIVLRPKDGAILAAATIPTFDPNNYSELYEKIPLMLTGTGTEWLKQKWKKEHRNWEILTGGLVYTNAHGPEAYRNRSITDLYEPGSIIKPLAMAAAIDAKEVTPFTTMYDTGAITVNEYKIDNWDRKHYGRITMTQVLEKSNNIGMAFVARKIGRKLLLSYYRKFGFGERAEIHLDDEPAGRMKKWRYLSDIELITYAFGQAISITPLQMASAFSAIANEGILMQPRLLETDEKRVINRPLAPETAHDVIGMMTSVIEHAGGSLARLRYFSVAGKTGTAQIGKRNGSGYEEGKGATIASFVGILPADNPQVVILIKVDRPRATQWGSEAAGPIFQEIATWYMNYLGVPAQKDRGVDTRKPAHLRVGRIQEYKQKNN